MTTAKKTKTTKTKAPIRKAKAEVIVREPNAEIAIPETNTVHKANLHNGKSMSRVSDEWAKRPDDQRFTSFEDLATFVRSRRMRSREVTVNLNQIVPDNDFLSIDLGKEQLPIKPTYHSYRQLCALLPFPAEALSKLSVDTQRTVIAEKIRTRRNGDELKLLIRDPEQKGQPAELAAITNPTYGRVYDEEIVQAIEWLLKIDPSWKVPGEFDWSTYRQNPYVETTKGNTTLFASDRDIFVFLCKDDQPIEVGKNEDGSTDVYFQGFYSWNSETGHCNGGIATFMLRGICANRCMHGVEGFKQFQFRHSRNATQRFMEKGTLAMRSLTEANYMPFVRLVAAAKARTIAKNNQEALEFLQKLGFTPAVQQAIFDACVNEEQREIRSLYDANCALTAYARRVPHNDKRLLIEAKAEQVLQMAA